MKFEAIDAVGNVATSEEMNVLIDGRKPTVSGFEPSGVWVRAPCNISVGVTVRGSVATFLNETNARRMGIAAE